MKVTINRLWNNLASVRSYLVQEAIERNEDLIIALKDGETMTIPNALIEKKKFKTNNGNFKSRWSKSSYSLIDFLWEPDTKKSPVGPRIVQDTLF